MNVIDRVFGHGNGVPTAQCFSSYGLLSLFSFSFSSIVKLNSSRKHILQIVHFSRMCKLGTSCGAKHNKPRPRVAHRGIARFLGIDKNVIRSSRGHSTPSLKISCKSVQPFARNLANKETKKDHRLNGSSSPVLTATCLSYGSLCDFLGFFSRTDLEVTPLDRF